jgi:hypothetical protein
MGLDYFEIMGFRAGDLMRKERLDSDLAAVISIILLLYSVVTRHLLIVA